MKMLLSAMAVLCLALPSCKNENNAPHTELFPVSKDGKFGYIDRQGKVSIPLQFSAATCFREGLAAVVINGVDNPKWGFIDKTGKYVINPAYHDVTSFSDGIAFAETENGAPMAIDKMGNVKFKMDNIDKIDVFNEGFAGYSISARVGSKWGFINKEGKIVITPQFNDIRMFSNGLCAVMDSNSKWGYINKAGKLVISYQFDNVSEFKNKCAYVAFGDKYGLIDTNGKYVINPMYDAIVVDGDLCQIEQNEKWGWADHSGNITISPQFDFSYPFQTNKYAPVKINGKCGYIDRKGKMVISAQFDKAYPFDGDIAAVTENGKIGFINMDGKIIINPQFDLLGEDYTELLLAPHQNFSQISSNQSSPGRSALKWLTAFYHMDYKGAEKYSTEQTKQMMSIISSSTNMYSESAKQNAMNIKVGTYGVKKDNDKAMVLFVTSENPDKVGVLDLVKQGNEWLVQFSKDDLNGNNRQ